MHLLISPLTLAGQGMEEQAARDMDISEKSIGYVLLGKSANKTTRSVEYCSLLLRSVEHACDVSDCEHFVVVLLILLLTLYLKGANLTVCNFHEFLCVMHKLIESERRASEREASPIGILL